MILTASLPAGVLFTLSAKPTYIIDPVAILVVLGGAALFMAGCFSVRELGMWIALGSGTRRARMPSETQRASQMCAVAALALAALAAINVLVGLITLLLTLDDPAKIGPAMAIMIYSLLWAFLPALPLAAMWAQITRPAA
jgi:flagellar motor component MotA